MRPHLFLLLLGCSAAPAGPTKGDDSGTPTTTTGASGTGGTPAGTETTPTGTATTPTGTDTTTGEPGGCNRHVALCDRPLDQVVFATTHNSHAASDAGFTVFNANHDRGIAAQLRAGVRGLLLDVYDDDGELALCHGPCALGRIPHREALTALVGFLEDHPREVVVLLYEDYVDPADLEADFVATGAAALAYTHDGGAWPTLGALADARTPLVVTAQTGRAPPGWLHNFWDIGFDTPYSYESIDAFSCDLNRGASDHDLFLVNHWVSTSLGLPDKGGAAEVNSAAVLEPRVRECQERWGRVANLVAVDWHEQGDLIEVVDRLNGL